MRTLTLLFSVSWILFFHIFTIPFLQLKFAPCLLNFITIITVYKKRILSSNGSNIFHKTRSCRQKTSYKFTKSYLKTLSSKDRIYLQLRLVVGVDARCVRQPSPHPSVGPGTATSRKIFKTIKKTIKQRRGWWLPADTFYMNLRVPLVGHAYGITVSVCL